MARSKLFTDLKQLKKVPDAKYIKNIYSGDIGNINFEQGDLVFFITNSGKTAEVINAISYTNSVCSDYHMTHRNLFTISSGYMEPELIRPENQLVYDSVDEMNPNGIILPNASVLITMLVGDLITNKIIREKYVSKRDFAINHPGGDIGTKSWLDR
jgi:D-arabinose 5-phosphate isomerase GutQ